MESSSDDLKRRFLDLLELRNRSSNLWHDVWCLLITHPWYQHILHQCAYKTLHAQGAPLDWLADVEQEATLLMSRSLRNAPNLYLPAHPPTPQFEAVLYATIARNCAEALRATRQKYRRRIRYSPPHKEPLPIRPLQRRIDLTTALSRLPASQRTALTLHLQHRSVTQIAKALSVHPSKAYRLLCQAKAEIRVLLKEAYGEDL